MLAVGPANVLMVDDHPENLLALEATLEGLGYNLIKASSGPEALKRALEQEFAVVLLDVQMPEMDGYETASILRARERSRHLPIIFLTAIYKDGDHVSRGYSVGAVDYLFKPCAPDILRAKVARFVELSSTTSKLMTEMVEQRETTREILKFNADLERRVVERTAELEAANAVLQAEMQARVATQVELERQREQVELQNEELQQQNQVLLEQNAELEQVEADRKEFLAMLSHELRNPLGVISNAAHLLDEVGLDDARAARLHLSVLRQSRNLSRIVDELLDISRVTHRRIALHRRPVELVGLVARAAEDFSLTCGGIRIVPSLSEQPLFVDGDPTRLEQVVVNLLRNAAEHGGGGPVELSLAQDGRAAVLRVRDHGPGIVPELLPRVFDLFVREERSSGGPGGLGVGLNLVRSLVEMHGGSADAYSEGPGHGAEFLIRLPLLSAVTLPTEDPAPGTVATEQRAAGGPVLVVEDNPDAAETLGDLLELWGYDVHLASSAQECLARAHELRPEVLILDIGLPGMDGYELARHLRKSFGVQGSDSRSTNSEASSENPDLKSESANPKSPILIALTGYGTEEDRRQALEAGFDYHLTKPADPDLLRRLLQAQRD